MLKILKIGHLFVSVYLIAGKLGANESQLYGFVTLRVRGSTTTTLFIYVL